MNDCNPYEKKGNGGETKREGMKLREKFQVLMCDNKIKSPTQIFWKSCWASVTDE